MDPRRLPLTNSGDVAPTPEEARAVTFKAFLHNSRMAPVLWVLWAVLSASPVNAFGLDGLPSQALHMVWLKRDVLPSDTVWSVLPGARGYLWLGTDAGLVRFDGVTFDVFNSETHDAFRSDIVRDVAQASNGDIWVATYGGGVLQLHDGQFRHFGKGDGLELPVVSTIHVTRNDVVWAGISNGACSLAPGEDRFRCWRGDGAPEGRVLRIAEDTDGHVWFATASEGVTAFDGSRFHTFGQAQGITDPQVFMAVPNQSAGVMIGTYTGELYDVDLEGGVRPFADPIPVAGTPFGATRDADGNLWLAIYTAGVRRYPDGALLGPGSLADLAIFAMAEGTDGDLWVASSKGLHLLGNSLFQPWGETEGVARGTFVVAAAPDGSVWIGAEGAGLTQVRDGTVVTRLKKPDGLPADSVSALAVDDDGTVWVGTFGGGVAVVRDGKVVRTLTSADGLPADQVASIYRAQDGAVWIGTAGGLAKLPDGHTVELTAGVAEGLEAALVRHITQQGEHLLLATDAGLVRLDALTGQVLDTLTEEVGLSSSVISSTLVDERGVVWIGQRNGGLARLEGERLFQYEREHGLRLPSIMGLTLDGEGDLWLGGRRGIARVSRAALEAVARGEQATVQTRYFSQRDGLREPLVPGGYQSPMAVARDGAVWFATTAGASRVMPSTVAPTGAPPAVAIEAIRVDGEETAVPGDKVAIPPGVRAVEIDYAAPSLRHGAQLRYRYRLASSDRWTEVGERRTAFFTSLPPRRQIFEVQATWEGVPFAAAQTAPMQLQLYVTPQWFQTRWFQVGVCLLCLAGLALTANLMANRYRRRQALLESLVDERTQALRAALKRVEIMSRTDSLTEIANRRYFEERLRTAWDEAVRQQLPISVMMLDIDYFKLFNDREGHLAGDECLRSVAGALQTLVRDSDLPARYGGEEFIVLLQGTDAQSALHVARRVQRGIRALQIPHTCRPDGTGVVTASAGFATAEPGIIDDPAELIERADVALYQAKERGRDQIVFDREVA